MSSRIQLATLLTASLAASAGAVEPRVEIQVGFGGHVRMATATPVRIFVDNPGKADRLTVRFREVSYLESALQEWELDVEAPAGARRLEHFVLRPLLEGPSRLEWSIDSGPWQQVVTPTALPRAEGWLAVAVTSRGGDLPLLEHALNPSGQGMAHVAVIDPEQLPSLPAAWLSVDVVLVDAEATPRIREAAWQALSDATLLGGSLIVHGLEPHVGPAGLLAGRPTGEPTTFMGGVGPAAVAVEGPDGERLGGWAPGEAPPWVSSRRHGAGQVLAVGVNLHDLPAGPDADTTWQGLVAVSAATIDQDLMSRRAGREGVRSSGPGPRGWSSRALMALGLGFAALGVAAAVAAWRLTRDGEARDRAWYLLPAGCAVLALPVWAVGVLDRALGAAIPTVVVEESFPDAGRSRVTTYLGPFGEKSVPDLALPGWPSWLEADGPRRAGTGRFVVGRNPLAAGFRAGFGESLGFASESWQDARPSFRMAGDGQVHNLSDADFDGVSVISGGKSFQAGPVRAGAAAAWATKNARKLTPAERAAAAAAEQLRTMPGTFVVGVTRGDRPGLLWTPSARLIVVRLAVEAP